MSETNTQFIFEYVFPWLGVVVGNMMYAAPYYDCNRASKSGDLGDLNPLPWTFMAGNTFGWLTYGILVGNLSIVCGSGPGLLLSIWLNMQAVKLEYARSYSEEMNKLITAGHKKQQEEEAAAVEAGRATSSDNNNHNSHITDSKNPNNSITTPTKQKKSLDSISVRDLFINSPVKLPVVPPPVPEESVRGTAGRRRHKRSYSLNDDGNADEESSIVDVEMESSSNDMDDKDQCNITTSCMSQIDIDPQQTTTNNLSSFDMIVVNINTAILNFSLPASQENVLLAVAICWLTIILMISFLSFSNETRVFIVGIAVNLNLVVFYGAPLSTIYIVLKTRVSASIHIPTMLLNTTNSIFWGVYGFAVGDPYVTIPNSTGVILGVIQIFLCLAFPRRRRRRKIIHSSGSVSHPNNNNSTSHRGELSQDFYESSYSKRKTFVILQQSNTYDYDDDYDASHDAFSESHNMSMVSDIPYIQQRRSITILENPNPNPSRSNHLVRFNLSPSKKKKKTITSNNDNSSRSTIFANLRSDPGFYQGKVERLWL